MNNYAKRNWAEYNKKLINRGSITFWLEQEGLNSWIQKTGKKGKPSFSKSVIQAGRIIKSVYRLSLELLQSYLLRILLILFPLAMRYNPS